VAMDINFDINIDLNTLLPLYFYPILSNTKDKKVLAVIQIALNNKGFLNNMNGNNNFVDDRF
jgi:hypothetical protein